MKETLKAALVGIEHNVEVEASKKEFCEVLQKETQEAWDWICPEGKQCTQINSN